MLKITVKYRVQKNYYEKIYKNKTILINDVPKNEHGNILQQTVMNICTKQIIETEPNLLNIVSFKWHN